MKSSPVGKKNFFMAILVLILLVPIDAFAQPPFYVALKPGIYSPQSSDLDGFDTGFNGELVLGYRFHPNIAVEFGIGYFNTEGEEKVGGTTYVGREFEMHVYPITFTLKAILPYKKWEFYGLGGAGAYIVSTPYDVECYDRYHDRYEYGDDDDYDTIFGGFLGAGILYNITPSIFLGVEGKYLWTDKAKLEYVEFGTPLEVQFRLDGIIATALVGFRF